MPAAWHYQLLAEEEILGLQPRAPREPSPEREQHIDQKNMTITASLPYALPRVILDRVFGRHRRQ